MVAFAHTAFSAWGRGRVETKGSLSISDTVGYQQPGTVASGRLRRTTIALGGHCVRSAIRAIGDIAEGCRESYPVEKRGIGGYDNQQ